MDEKNISFEERRERHLQEQSLSIGGVREVRKVGTSVSGQRGPDALRL